MSYHVEYTESSEADLKALDGSQQKIVRKAIDKISENPLPKKEGGYGNPLGNRGHNNLAGLCKIKLLKLGIRVVYKLIRERKVMKIIVIAARADNEVYDIATKRLNNSPLGR